MTFWDKSLLAARSHSSVLSANNQVLAALTGHEGEAYIQASAVRNGIEVESSSSDDFDQPWAVNELGQVGLLFNCGVSTCFALMLMLTFRPISPRLHCLPISL